MELTTRGTPQESQGQTLGWAWIASSERPADARMAAPADLSFWAGLKACVDEAACANCREALRGAMQALCSEQRAAEVTK